MMIIKNNRLLRAIILVFMMAALLLVPGCKWDYIEHPPLGSVKVENASNYMKVNGYTEAIREQRNIDLMPETVNPDHITRYLYWYQNSFFTTPEAQYGILLKTGEMKPDEIQAEKNRLSGLDSVERIDGEDGVLFIWAYDLPFYVEMMLDAIPYDGAWIDITLAEFSNDNTVTYMDVTLVDGRIWDEEIEQTLTDIVLRYARDRADIREIIEFKQF